MLNILNSNAEKDIFFNEILFCTMRRVYSRLFIRNDYIRGKEQETRVIIRKLADYAAKRGHYTTTRVKLRSLLNRELL